MMPCKPESDVVKANRGKTLALHGHLCVKKIGLFTISAKGLHEAVGLMPTGSAFQQYPAT